MSLSAEKGSLYRYEQLRDISHLKNMIMQSLKLTGAAIVAPP
jgi:hypothetical protein